MKFRRDFILIGSKALIADLHLGLVRFYDKDIIRRTIEIAEKAKTIVVVGDLKHLGKPSPIEEFFREVGGIAELIVIRGNHDIGIVGYKGIRIGKYGIFHGHAIPDDEIFQAKHLIFAHAHPSILIQDEVGGYKERVFLLGELEIDNEKKRVTVMPAFNDLCASTPVNLEKPAGFMFRRHNYSDWYAMLLDGTVLSLNSLII